MFYYLVDDQVLVSAEHLEQFREIPEAQAQNSRGMVFFIYRQDPARFRRSFAVTDPSLAFLKEEGIDLLIAPSNNYDIFQLPFWLKEKVRLGLAGAVNILYPNWQDVLKSSIPDQWRVNIVGLGDVGGTLLTGLRLLGGGAVKEIGIFDQNPDKMERWDYEANQILSPFSDAPYPPIASISEADFFNCDIFVFCVSVGVPPVGQEEKDVRLVQFEGNARIINYYAKMARQEKFPGIFAVVSDPVDLLCKSAFNAGNTDQSGQKDYMGLAPEQIRGFGLGVMSARAAYFARKNPEIKEYLTEGRAYGPHGDGLVIANSIENYDDERSRYLTHQAVKANLKVRGLGFKPYIAPALSSGTLSLLALMEGRWHYSATFMGGIFMGAKNRLTAAGTELERLPLPDQLVNRLNDTYQLLGRYQL